jgi:hypothetical protein
MSEKVTVNEYYGNDFSRSYEAKIIGGKIIEIKEVVKNDGRTTSKN